MRYVWVIEDGEYSGYRVVGVYSSRENAKKALATFDSGSIARWPLNPNIDEINQGMSRWRVFMRGDGTVEAVDISKSSHESIDYVAKTGHSSRPFPFISSTVWATDETHAVKIVNEKRAQAIAEGRL